MTGKQSIQVGQRLIITLDNEKVVGTLQKLKEEYLRLLNVEDFETKEKVGAQCIYYVSKIRAINIVTDDVQGKNEDPSVPQTPETPASDKVVDNCTTISMSKGILEQLNAARHYTNVIFIRSHDCTFFDAIKDIKMHRTIGLHIENVNFGRDSTSPAILSIYTGLLVYLFDLMALRKIRAELKDILESKQVQKCVYYSKSMIDFLRHVHKIKLNNFFDVVMAFMCVTDTREVLKIDEMILKLYNLDIGLNYNVKWDVRPCTEVHISTAATKVVFLIELQHTLIHDYMLTSFYESSRKQMSELSRMREPPFKAKPVLQNDKENVEFDDIRDGLKRLSM